MKTKLAITREFSRINKLMKKNDRSAMDVHSTYGAMQALAWALDRNAMAPSRAFKEAKR